MTQATAVYPLHTEFPSSVWVIPLTDDCVIGRLAINVLARAVKDAIGRDIPGGRLAKEVARNDAMTWLTSPACDIYCQLAEVSFEKLCGWVKRGCPKPDESEWTRQKQVEELDPFEGWEKIYAILKKARRKRGRPKGGKKQIVITPN